MLQNLYAFIRISIKPIEIFYIQIKQCPCKKEFISFAETLFINQKKIFLKPIPQKAHPQMDFLSGFFSFS